MCTAKSCSHAETAKAKSLPRVGWGLLSIGLAAGLSLHLRASHFAQWWVLPVVALIVAHGAVVGAVAWIVSHRRGRRADPATEAGHASHGHTHPHGPSNVLHRPRLYDWLVRLHTLGSEEGFRSAILELAQLQPGESVLDVGCGTGSLLVEAAKKTGCGQRLHGVEPSLEMLARARRKAGSLIAESNLVQGSADRIPFPDRTFDVVFCTMVLHHLPAGMQLAAVAEMCRVARPGGRIVIVDMQPPQTLASKLSIVTLFHKFATDATPPDWSRIEEALRQGGAGAAACHPMWSGAARAMIALVPRAREATGAEESAASGGVTARII